MLSPNTSHADNQHSEPIQKTQHSVKDAFRISSVPILLASLCCLSPVILVLLGLTTASFAASLSDTLYGQYRWAFRIVGLLALAASVVWYLRKHKGICTLDQVKRQKNQVINVILLSLIVGIVGYIVWLYVVVEYLGKILSIWP